MVGLIGDTWAKVEALLGRTREEERWLVQTVKTCSGKPICLLINRFLQVAAGTIRTDVFRQ